MTTETPDLRFPREYRLRSPADFAPLAFQPRKEWNSPSGSGSFGVNGVNA